MTNRAFEDLERRSRTITRKRYLKIFIFLLIIVSIIFIVIFELFFNPQDIKPKQKVLSKKIVKEVKEAIKLPKQEKKIDKNDSYDTVFLKPTIIVPIIKKKLKNIEPKKKIEKLVHSLKKELKVKPKPIINIQVKSLKDEQSLIKANKEIENFDSTLKLAKYYYKNEKYQKSLFFAKKANRYKPTSFKPWYYYAKAKVKQNKREDAINAIEEYLRYFSSDEAQKLLQEIKGKK